MYVSVTALKTNGFFSAIHFWLLAAPTFKQTKSSQGTLFCEVKSVDGFHHTLTAWETKKYEEICILTNTFKSDENLSQNSYGLDHWV